MAIRKDGLNTRRKLLDAALQVFADDGYRSATVAQICELAGSNVAAVNYHFGTKEHLYAAVWKDAFEKVLGVCPPQSKLAPGANAEERLRELVLSLVHRFTDAGKVGYPGRLLLRELTNPTGVINQASEDAAGSLGRYTRLIIRELTGPGATSRQVKFCQMSLMNQCIGLGLRGLRLAGESAGETTGRGDIDLLTEHITRFTLAGIAAVRAGIEQKMAQSKPAEAGLAKSFKIRQVAEP